LISSLKYPTVKEILYSEVIIGMSRAVEALITAAFVISLFLAISYGKIKGLVI
jgi:hypothetical protein